VVWIGATSEIFVTLTGGIVNDEIQLKGFDQAGEELIWKFVDIKEDSFYWTGHVRKSPDRNWKLEQTMSAKRLE
jgi:hypothetical protein